MNTGSPRTSDHDVAPADPSTPEYSPADHLPPHKAVIMARGLGTRMRRDDHAAQLDEKQAEIAATGVKALIDVGRPFLDYVISALMDAGITEVCLVIGPEHDALREYAAATTSADVTVTTAIQAEPRGTADAVAAAKDFAGTDRVVVLNSDNYYPASVLTRLVQEPGNALLGFDRAALVENSNIPAERIQAFAIIDVGEDRQLREIVEKPDPATLDSYGPTAPVSMNAWLFTPEIFSACAAVEPSERGELEIIDAVRELVRRGENLTVVPVASGVLDLSSRADIAGVQAALAQVQVRW